MNRELCLALNRAAAAAALDASQRRGQVAEFNARQHAAPFNPHVFSFRRADRTAR